MSARPRGTIATCVFARERDARRFGSRFEKKRIAESPLGPVVSVRAPSGPGRRARGGAGRGRDRARRAGGLRKGGGARRPGAGRRAPRGHARALRALVLEGKWDPRVARDRHGAGALLWSAGAGHLACVRLLCEEALAGREPLDPNDPATHQGGRRAYRGRTALHWAARNGHLDVVRYAVTEKNADVDARTRRRHGGVRVGGVAGPIRSGAVAGGAGASARSRR